MIPGLGIIAFIATSDDRPGLTDQLENRFEASEGLAFCLP